MEFLIAARSQTDGTEQRIRIPADGPVVLGRGPESPVLLAGTGISRDHLRLQNQGDTVRVTDLSSNGTWINGRRLTRGQPYALRPGEAIQVPGYDITIAVLDLQPAGAVAADSAAEPDTPARISRSKLAFLAPVHRFMRSFSRLEKFLVLTTAGSVALLIAYLSG